jgi:hypothetical protein
MANYNEFKPVLGEIARYLRILRDQSCNSNSSLSPVAATSADDPYTLPSGYTNLIVTKTNGSGTVEITFPDGSTTYTLTSQGEEFRITGNPKLGSYEIALASGATYKLYAY